MVKQSDEASFDESKRSVISLRTLGDRVQQFYVLYFAKYTNILVLQYGRDRLTWILYRTTFQGSNDDVSLAAKAVCDEGRHIVSRE